MLKQRKNGFAKGNFLKFLHIKSDDGIWTVPSLDWSESLSLRTSLLINAKICFDDDHLLSLSFSEMVQKNFFVELVYSLRCCLLFLFVTDKTLYIKIRRGKRSYNQKRTRENVRAREIPWMFESKIEYERKTRHCLLSQVNGLGTFLFAFFFTTFAFFCKKKNTKHKQYRKAFFPITRDVPSAVASWYCWYSLTRSFMFDSASVNS